MEAKLLGLLQDFSFDTGQTQNYLKLRLPNGDVINTAVSEEIALSTMRAFVGEGPEKLATAGEEVIDTTNTPLQYEDGQLKSFSPLRLSEEEAAEEFEPPDEEVPAYETSMPTPSWGSGGNGRRPVVQANSAGYPVAAGHDVQDPGELVGDGELDEDGVGSI